MEAILISASTGALEALIPKLGKMLTDKYKLHTGAKEGIRYIQKELESIKAVLEKVSNMPPNQLDGSVKPWVREVRRMSYKIEDTIDSYMLLVDAADGKSDGSSTTCCVSMSGKYMMLRRCKARGSIATEIEHIKKEVEEVSNRRDRYKVDSISEAPAQPDPRLPVLFQDKAELVGIGRPAEEIIKLLSMEDEKGASTSEQKLDTTEQTLKLVSIIGPGGMGKTTLANEIYKKLEQKFDCTAFVSVSLRPDMKNILSSILRQVMASKIRDDLAEDEDDKDKRLHRRESQKHHGNTESWSEKEIIDKIRHVLERRRYLILIDDIWNEQSWKLIECALFENKLGSKVITTTRNIEVARSCCSSYKENGFIYPLQRLSDEDSKKLLYYKVFGSERCPEELVSVSQKILEKCEGWPLAIITIASLLKTNEAQTKDRWSSVYNSISTGLENNKGVKDMQRILSLSYNDMPAQLRDCLLYLSIFPEDHIIGRDDLIQRWIAEDLVHGRRQDDNLHELGDKYFNELINRSMIQASDEDAFGKAQACKVHDLVLDFVTSLSDEEGFVTILNEQKPFLPQPDSILRLSLRNREGQHGIPTASRLPHVRTLVVSSHAINSMPSLSVFPALRVLELEWCTTRNIKGVENLVHLRFLRITQAPEYHFYHNDVCIILPKGIGNLQLLQTLDLKDARIKGLPLSVVQFRQLRVLEISLRNCDKTSEKRFIQCLCNAKQLEALCIFAPGSSLDFMLQIDWTPSLRKFIASPRKQTEHILRRGSVWAEFNLFSTLPRWINSSLSCLTDLSIMVKTLQQADLEILAKLLVLRSLELEVVKPSGTRIEVNASVRATGQATTAFRYLGNLKFASRAVGLVFNPGAMQKLQKLYLCFDVAETKDVYGDFSSGLTGLENLTSLKILNVDIDCRCARLWEVEATEAALRNAAELNPSGPAFDLKRYFEAEMQRSGQEEETPELLQANKKEDVLLSRFGPFGGDGGRARDIRVAPHRLTNVTIRFGDAVNSLAFSYDDHNGQQHSAGPWGGPYGRSSTIPIGTSEYLIKVSGTTGSCHGIDKLITSLTFVTNTVSHGPFGKRKGDPFEFHVPSNSRIVGFFGRAGMSLDAVGFYFRPV